MKTRLFLTSTAVLAAALLGGSTLAATPSTQNHQAAVIASASLHTNSTTLIPDLTIAPADQKVAFASHASHSSHSSHASHSSHTSSSFV
jgi:hypothetical protein